MGFRGSGVEAVGDKVGSAIDQNFLQSIVTIGEENKRARARTGTE